MTDQEINEAVARKLGWIQCCNPKTIENGKIVDCFGWSKGGSHFHEAYPDYCHSIAVAWEILNRPRINYSIMSSENGVQVIINNKMAEADTAAMAICLAFLKLNETTVPEVKK